MPMTEKDIRQLFEMDGAVIRWREVPVAGLPALFLRAAQKHNQKAGTKVEFWSGSGNSKMVTVAGVAVTVDRIRKVLGAKAEREARKAERGPGVKSAAAVAGTLSLKVKAWSDPTDPEPSKDDREAWDEWSMREYERLKAWRANQ